MIRKIMIVLCSCFLLCGLTAYAKGDNFKYSGQFLCEDKTCLENIIMKIYDAEISNSDDNI